VADAKRFIASHLHCYPSELTLGFKLTEFADNQNIHRIAKLIPHDQPIRVDCTRSTSNDSFAIIDHEAIPINLGGHILVDELIAKLTPRARPGTERIQLHIDGRPLKPDEALPMLKQEFITARTEVTPVRPFSARSPRAREFPSEPPSGRSPRRKEHQNALGNAQRFGQTEDESAYQVPEGEQPPSAAALIYTEADEEEDEAPPPVSRMVEEEEEEEAPANVPLPGIRPEEDDISPNSRRPASLDEVEEDDMADPRAAPPRPASVEEEEEEEEPEPADQVQEDDSDDGTE
jgi:hypothetical protein